MKFLELPVKFQLNNNEGSTEYKDLYEELGIEREEDIEDGILHVYPPNISTFNENSDGNITLVMNNGIYYTIYMTEEEFKKGINYEKC